MSEQVEEKPKKLTINRLILIFLMSTGIAKFCNRTQSHLDIIRKTAAEINQKCPIRVDEECELTSLEVGTEKITYHYRMLGILRYSNPQEKEIRERDCKSEGMQNLVLRRGMSIHYS